MVIDTSFSKGPICSAVFESYSWNSFQQGPAKEESNDQKIIKENQTYPVNIILFLHSWKISTNGCLLF